MRIWFFQTSLLLFYSVFSVLASENPNQVQSEDGLVQMLKKMFPGKEFYGVAYHHKSCDESCVCPYMKAITLGKVRRALEQEKFEITVSEETRRKALLALERMLKLGRDN